MMWEQRMTMLEAVSPSSGTGVTLVWRDPDFGTKGDTEIGTTMVWRDLDIDTTLV